jgi:hypothetical protein
MSRGDGARESDVGSQLPPELKGFDNNTAADVDGEQGAASDDEGDA